MRLNESNATYRVTYYDQVTYHRSLAAAERSASDLPRLCRFSVVFDGNE